jgi:hypothetical protein
MRRLGGPDDLDPAPIVGDTGDLLVLAEQAGLIIAEQALDLQNLTGLGRMSPDWTCAYSTCP